MTPTPPYRVVLVDDVREIREILALMLEQSGWFDVAGHASSGAEAITVAEQVKPDVVLLDIVMPVMSGWEALPKLRATVPDARVVILSGSKDEVDAADEATRALAAGVLEKGISGSELVERLLDVLRAGPPPPPGNLEEVTFAGEAVIEVGTDGTITGWNSAAVRLLGRARADAIGRPIDAIAPPDRQGEPGRLVERARSDGAIDYLETAFLRGDGAPVDVAVAVTPHAGGSTVRARDITARRHSAAALARAVAQLERQNRELLRSNEELDSFAYVASHDLAQPLQVAYGYLEMLRADYSDSLDDAGREWLAAALASLERMRRLVRDILQYARSGNAAAADDVVSLDEVVADALSAVRVAVDEAGADVRVGGLPDVRGSAGQLTQVFQNLLANAIKFTRPGVPPEVEITAQPAADADRWIVSVADNGRGIPKEHHDKVFEMFQRGTAGDTAGTGLGLAICRKIVARHGGHMWVDDRPGGGTIIHLTLPAAG